MKGLLSNLAIAILASSAGNAHALKKCLLAICLALDLTAGATGAAQANHYSHGWYSAYSRTSSYGYRYYHYYSPVYRSYRYHVAVYYPSRPRYVYYYNPYTKMYWGRYDCLTGGYSKLNVDDRRGTIGKIPESAFAKKGEGPMPAIADSDGTPMLPPPEGLVSQQSSDPPSASSLAPAPSDGSYGSCR